MSKYDSTDIKATVPGRTGNIVVSLEDHDEVVAAFTLIDDKDDE